MAAEPPPKRSRGCPRRCPKAADGLLITILSIWLLAAPVAARPEEPMEMRLWRTMATGYFQDLTSGDIVSYLQEQSPERTGYVLARAALEVLGEVNPFPEWPLFRVLENELASSTGPFFSARGRMREFPRGFGSNERIYSLVYAMVVAGRADRAVETLRPRLALGSRRSRDVAAQALKLIGTPETEALIDAYRESQDSAVAGNLKGQRYFPPLEDLARHWNLIPPGERDRCSLYRVASGGTGKKACLAVYLLGFYPPPADRRIEERELSLLREGARSSHFSYGYFSTRALALRSPETPEFWRDLFVDATSDPWKRGLIVLCAFARHGEGFSPTALELLGGETVQYVQWKLMHGAVTAWTDTPLFTYWDIWLRPDLQLRLDRLPRRKKLPPKETDALLRWLEEGNRPRNIGVLQQLLVYVARSARGSDVRRFLRAWDRLLPDKTRNWWMLGFIEDPRALPILKYWRNRAEASGESGAILDDTISELERRSASQGPRDPSPACCAPEEPCLRQILAARAAGRGEAEISTAEDAKAWLDGTGPGDSRIRIVYKDDSKRSARVIFGKNEEVQHWEHLYGCWIRAR